MTFDRIGLWTPTLDFVDAGTAREIVAELDEQGWGSLWFGEAYGREAYTAAQAYLAAAPRIAVGTGIANIYARDPFATAAASRLINELFPDRFILGLGVSHAPLVERLRGHQYGKPLQAMREYLEALDAAPNSTGGSPPLPRRVIAALGPKMLELAGTHADGAHPYLVTPEHTRQAREILGPDKLLVVEQAAVLEKDETVWREAAHAHLNIYTGLPNYRNSWLRQGFSEDDAVRGGSERLKQALVTRGLDETRERVTEHLQAGASTVLVQVLGTDPTTPPRSDWSRLAQALL